MQIALDPASGEMVGQTAPEQARRCLENIRAMPWEKNRPDKAKAVKHGTYGIGPHQ